MTRNTTLCVTLGRRKKQTLAVVSGYLVTTSLDKFASQMFLTLQKWSYESELSTTISIKSEPLLSLMVKL